MHDIRRWTRTVIPGAVSLALFLACVWILAPGWRSSVQGVFKAEAWSISWAGLGLVAATVLGYVQSQIYFGFGWEWMTIPYERLPGAEEIEIQERTRSRTWAKLSHKWQFHADCFPGFDSVNARLEGLGDALHALGGILAGSVLSAIGMVLIAFAQEPRAGCCQLSTASLVWLVWFLLFVRAYVELRNRFQWYVRDNLDRLHEHAGPCKGMSKNVKPDSPK